MPVALHPTAPIIESLAPVFTGLLADSAGTLVVVAEPPPDALPVARLLADSPLLHQILVRNHAFLKASGTDIRASASMWHMRYLWTLLPYTMAALTLFRHALPMLPTEMWLEVDADGQPMRFYVTGPGSEMPETAAQARYEALVFRHLEPLTEALNGLTRLSRHIAWVNVARHVQAVFDGGHEQQAFAHVSIEDRRALLDDPHWARVEPGPGDTPGGYANPLFQPPREVRLPATPDAPSRTVQVHRACCLYYKLGEPRYCGACPLAPENRPRKPKPFNRG